jgi:hypothetical protein
VVVMRSCCAWRASIGAATLPDRPLPREDEFRLAPREYAITCRYQSKRAQRCIRLQLFPSTFR